MKQLVLCPSPVALSAHLPLQLCCILSRGPAPIHGILIQDLGWEPVCGDVRTGVHSG